MLVLQKTQTMNFIYISQLVFIYYKYRKTETIHIHYVGLMSRFENGRRFIIGDDCLSSGGD
jgi:hypothetical protein